MDEKSFKLAISKYESEETKSVINSIDVDFLTSGNIKLLNYAFPLIEKMVIEIFKLLPDSNVEKYEQGTMKTIMAVIEENNQEYIIPKDVEEKISKYFKEECLRNTLFHPSDEVEIKIDDTCILDVLWIIAELLKILNELLKKYSNFEFNDIEYLK